MNPGVILDDGLSYTPNITAVAKICRSALYNMCRIQSFLTEDATQLLVRALVTSQPGLLQLLAGLPDSVTKPLQRIHNAAAHLIYNLTKISHLTPLFCDLHWLPVVAHIRFKVMVLAFKAVNGTAPVFPPNTDQTTSSISSTSLHSISWPAGNTITESKQSSLSKVTTGLCSCDSGVEQTLDQCQDSRVAPHLQQKTQYSLVQTSPGPRIA